ncbi:hypothetical protein F4810DRAFT_721643 [Camillea tinctor]|nr:hypothetical protein F4810DRAFT_721643 [Camillea tinctor]
MAATILITGATGLIGFRILLVVLAAGHSELASGDRFFAVIIPDFIVDGIFDSVLQGITHIIHAGFLVPVPTYELTT